MAGSGGRRGPLDRGRQYARRPAWPRLDYKAVIFLSTSRDTLWKHGTAVSTDSGCQHDDQCAPRRRQNRAAPVHPRRRRLRRHPQRVRHRVQLALVRRPARQRQLLRPRRSPERHGRDRGRGLSTAGLPARGLQGRVVQPGAVPDQGEVPGHRRREHTAPREARRTRATATSIRSPGASTTTAAAPGSPRSVTTPRPSPTVRDSRPGSSSRSLIVNGIMSAMGNIPFCQ